MTDEKPTTNTEATANAILVATKWFFGRDSAAIVLMLILGFAGWFSWYMVDTLVPSWHGQWIKAVDDLDKRHEASIEATDKAHREHVSDIVGQHKLAIQSLETTFERTLDRIEDRNRLKVSAIPPPLSEVATP